jgi:hypothetical protein
MLGRLALDFSKIHRTDLGFAQISYCNIFLEGVEFTPTSALKAGPWMKTIQIVRKGVGEKGPQQLHTQ